jgi:hypothetical protein
MIDNMSIEKKDTEYQNPNSPKHIVNEDMFKQVYDYYVSLPSKEKYSLYHVESKGTTAINSFKHKPHVYLELPYEHETVL